VTLIDRLLNLLRLSPSAVPRPTRSAALYPEPPTPAHAYATPAYCPICEKVHL
jgi:hypothetical protein